MGHGLGYARVVMISVSGVALISGDFCTGKLTYAARRICHAETLFLLADRSELDALQIWNMNTIFSNAS